MPWFLSRITKSTPYRMNWQASESPVGPAPLIMTSVLIVLFILFGSLVRTGSRGDDQPPHQHDHDAGVIGEVGHCAGTDTDGNREDPDQCAQQRECLSGQTHPTRPCWTDP